MSNEILNVSEARPSLRALSPQGDARAGRRPAGWALLVLAFAVRATAAGFEPADFVELSIPGVPRVTWAIARDDRGLVVTVDAAPLAAASPAPRVELGAAAARQVVRTASAGGTDAGRTATFRIAARDLVDDNEQWQRLRLAVRVCWPDGTGGDLQQERFRCLDGRAPHAPLPADPQQWQPLDLVEHARTVADRKSRIAIPFAQPCDGRATVVIETPDGRRVRNLIAGRDLSRAQHDLPWDGLDDAGVPVPPAAYRWRSASHPGIRPRYLFAFGNGPGSNHGTLSAATTDGRRLYFGTPVSEGGHELVALEPDGTFVAGWVAPHGHGLQAIAIAADTNYLYAAYDGISWGQHIDRTKTNWTASFTLGLVRVDLARRELTDWPNRVRVAPLAEYTVGPGHTEPRPDRTTLTSLALLDGKLYAGDWFGGGLMVIDPATGRKTGHIPLAHPGALAAAGHHLLVVSGTSVVRLDPLTGQSTVLVDPDLLDPRGLAADAAGSVYISDARTHTVKVLAGRTASGQPRLTTLGTPGGAYTGAYDPQRLISTGGLTVGPNGWVWVTEPGRWTPKRLAAFDPATGKTVRALFGPTAYGAPGAGFDPLDPTRWLALGAQFRLDFATRQARPETILGGRDGMHYRFWRQEGRTFVISYGKATFIQELRADGTLQPLACISSAHQFAYYCDWKPPAAFTEAFNRDYPDTTVGKGSPRQPGHGFGMLWVDRSGDGDLQADEIEFATTAQNLAGSGWGHDQADLTIRVAATVSNRSVLVSLKPEGWHPGGAPRYPPLARAVAAALPIELPPFRNSVESTVDRFGNLILNSDPTMTCFGPDGRLRWTYPNRWTNVHGSHNAPLPKPGELQGVLFFTGVAPLDDQGDVMVMNGNHGRLFVMTTDGLYLDEMFRDVRVGGVADEYLIGGECFGGTFGRSEKDGTYYLQAGGIAYRVFRLDGLSELTRQQGTLQVTAAQAAAAERTAAQRKAETQPPRLARLERRAQPPLLDGKADDWPATPTLQWDRDRQFPVTVRLACDNTTLYLLYQVRDESPWVNHGTDWQALFKTGDSVDLQLGTDPRAPPGRTAPVPGDLRLLFAPQGATNRVVLYRHRLPAAARAAVEPEAVTFQSPWRSERVDSVTQLSSARMAVRRGNGEYWIEAAVPLAALGLDPAAGSKLRADVGVIYGDTGGTINLFRNYWANPATMLVNDVPGEIMLTPHLWGTLTLDPSPRNTQETQP